MITMENQVFTDEEFATVQFYMEHGAKYLTKDDTGCTVEFWTEEPVKVNGTYRSNHSIPVVQWAGNFPSVNSGEKIFLSG